MFFIIKHLTILHVCVCARACATHVCVFDITVFPWYRKGQRNHFCISIWRIVLVKRFLLCMRPYFQSVGIGAWCCCLMSLHSYCSLLLHLKERKKYIKRAYDCTFVFKLLGLGSHASNMKHKSSEFYSAVLSVIKVVNREASRYKGQYCWYLQMSFAHIPILVHQVSPILKQLPIFC